MWDSRSAISNSDEDLVLTRWDMTAQWAPWNSFLITSDELDAHKAVSAQGEGYVTVVVHIHRVVVVVGAVGSCVKKFIKNI